MVQDVQKRGGKKGRKEKPKRRIKEHQGRRSFQHDINSFSSQQQQKVQETQNEIKHNQPKYQIYETYHQILILHESTTTTLKK